MANKTSLNIHAFSNENFFEDSAYVSTAVAQEESAESTWKFSTAHTSLSKFTSPLKCKHKKSAAWKLSALNTLWSKWLYYWIPFIFTSTTFFGLDVCACVWVWECCGNEVSKKKLVYSRGRCFPFILLHFCCHFLWHHPNACQLSSKSKIHMQMYAHVCVALCLDCTHSSLAFACESHLTSFEQDELTLVPAPKTVMLAFGNKIWYAEKACLWQICQHPLSRRNASRLRSCICIASESGLVSSGYAFGRCVGCCFYRLTQVTFTFALNMFMLKFDALSKKRPPAAWVRVHVCKCDCAFAAAGAYANNEATVKGRDKAIYHASQQISAPANRVLTHAHTLLCTHSLVHAYAHASQASIGL